VEKTPTFFPPRAGGAILEGKTVPGLEGSRASVWAAVLEFRWKTNRIQTWENSSRPDRMAGPTKVGSRVMVARDEGARLPWRGVPTQRG